MFSVSQEDDTFTTCHSTNKIQYRYCILLYRHYFVVPILYFVVPILYFIVPILYFVVPILYFVVLILYFVVPILYFVVPILYFVVPILYLAKYSISLHNPKYSGQNLHSICLCSITELPPSYIQVHTLITTGARMTG